MISFLLTGLRLLRAVVRGLRQDDDFRALLALFLVTTLGGTIFYASVEEWSIIDALYFCVMTMSTIGYGDFTPSTPFSKIFTIIYTLVSIGLFAAVASKIVAYILRRSKKPEHRPGKAYHGPRKKPSPRPPHSELENEN